MYHVKICPSNALEMSTLSFIEYSILFTQLQCPLSTLILSLRFRTSHNAIVVSSLQVANIRQSKNLKFIMAIPELIFSVTQYEHYY